MAERRYKPTPENERLVKQFIESSKRAGYDPTFTNIIVKEVSSDKTGKVRNRVANAQSKIEKQILAKSVRPKAKAKTETDAKTPPGSSAKKQTTIAERRRRFREAANAFKKQEMADVYEQAGKDLKKDFKSAGVFLARDVALPLAVGGGLTLAIKAATAAPAVVRGVQALAKARRARTQVRSTTKTLKAGRTHKMTPLGKKALPVRKELTSGRVPKQLPQRGTAGRQPAKKPFGPRELNASMRPDPVIKKLAAEKGRQLNKKQLEKIANEFAGRGKAASRPLTKLERIAEDYIRKPNPSKLERLAEAYIKRPKPKPRVRLKSPSKTILKTGGKETVIGKLAKEKAAQLNKKQLERIANAYAGRGQSVKRPLTKLERMAEDYVNKPTSSKLERIADAYIKQPKKPSAAQLEKMANAYIKGPYAQKLGLKDEMSASLTSFLQAEGIKNARQLRSSFASLVSKLKSSAKPARARELQRLLNLSGR